MDRVAEQARVFFGALMLIRVTGNRTRVTGEHLAPAADQARRLLHDLGELERALSHLDDASEDVLALARRAEEIRDQLRFLLDASDVNFVYFLEWRGKAVFLRAAPIDVSAIVRESLLQRIQGAILTSATLTVDNSFDYLRGRLGIDEAFELRLPSEFDFKEQAVLYLPRQMPDPRSGQFATAVTSELTGLLNITRGRAFVLFTSYANLREVHRQLEAALPYPLLVQGFRTSYRAAARVPVDAAGGPSGNVELLAGCRCRRRCAELRGDRQAAICLAGRPDHGCTDAGDRDARGERVRRLSSSARDLDIAPGSGSFDPHRSDRGVLALLDGRIRTKGYGRRFLASLRRRDSHTSSRTFADSSRSPQHAGGPSGV